MKKIISILLAIIVLTQMVCSVAVYATETTAFASVTITENGLLVKGNSGGFKDAIAIFLLRPGVSEEEVITADDGEAIFLLAQYANVIDTEYNGDFSVEIKTNIETDKTYTLKLAGKEINKIYKISNQGSVNKREELVNFIRFYDDKVIVDGYAETENQNVTFYVFDENVSIYEILSDESKAVTKLNVVSGENGYFSIEIPVNFQLAKTYNLYASIVGENGEIYEISTHKLKKPETLYVGEEFKTINDARDYLRTNLRDVPVNVIIKDGKYHIVDTLTFTSTDKRTADTAVTYRAENKGNAIISGAKKINSYESIRETDNVYSRIPEKARKNIVKINLNEHGIDKEYYDFVSYYLENATILNENKSIVSGKNVVPLTVLLNGNPQRISSYPDSGFAENADCVNGYDDRIVVGKELAQKWKNATDMFIRGYYAYSWAGECSIVTDINASNGVLKFGYDALYGVKPLKEDATIRWSANNLPEEMDMPGEWYLNSDSGELYYYTPYKLTDKDSLELALIDRDLISFNDTEYIYFDGITVAENSPSRYLYNYEPSRSNGIEFLDSKYDSNHIRLDNCIINNIGGNGISVYGDDHKYLAFENLVIYNTGYSGIYLSAGKSTALVENKSVIRNCDISNPSLYTDNNLSACIKLGGCGTLVEHNILRNSKSIGLRYAGTCNLIRYNEFYNNSYEQSDSSAIYAGRSWNQYGTVITKNLIHNTGADSYLGAGTMGVYLDDYHGGNTITSNIFVNNKADVDYAAIHIGQGPDNVANGNTFVNTVQNTRTVNGVEMSYRSITIGPLSASLNEADGAYFERFESVKKYKDVYSGIPEDASYYSYAQKKILKGYKENYEAKNNIGFAMSNVFYHPSASSSGWGKKEWNKIVYNHTMTGVAEDNVKVEDIFVDSKNLDFRVKDGLVANNNVLSESNFDINIIGIQNTDSYLHKPCLVAPLNGENKEAENIVLVWGQTGIFDSYKYDVATDNNFKEIVASGITKDSYVKIDNVETDNTYYWRVTGIKEGRVKEYNESLVSMFTVGTPLSENTVFGDMELKVTDTEIVVKDNIVSIVPVGFNVSYILIAEKQNGDKVYKVVEHKFSQPGFKEVKLMDIVDKEQFIKYVILRWENFKTLKPIESYKSY